MSNLKYHKVKIIEIPKEEPSKWDRRICWGIILLAVGYFGIHIIIFLMRILGLIK